MTIKQAEEILYSSGCSQFYNGNGHDMKHNVINVILEIYERGVVDGIMIGRDSIYSAFNKANEQMAKYHNPTI